MTGRIGIEAIGEISEDTSGIIERSIPGLDKRLAFDSLIGCNMETPLWASSPSRFIAEGTPESGLFSCGSLLAFVECGDVYTGILEKLISLNPVSSPSTGIDGDDACVRTFSIDSKVCETIVTLMHFMV